MSINLSLHDAATNCARDGATAVLILRSGVAVEGKLEKPISGRNTTHVRTQNGGWATVLIEEIASVEARP